MHYPRIILAGTHSGVGKTTLALGLMLALKKRGLKVQPFKTGPDYIDPGYFSETTERPAGNLDSWLFSPGVILELFQRRSNGADVSIIEGVMGLYDGWQDTDKGSTSHLAKILNSPLILVLDVRSLSRSAAAIALGYREFDKKVNIKGIILNNVGSKNHLSSVKSAIEEKVKIPILGYLPKDADLKLPERHLGLIPAEEKKLHYLFYKKLLHLLEKNMDIERILKICFSAGPLSDYKKTLFTQAPHNNSLTIAIARDKAFNFYYPDNLDILRHLGAKIVEFDTLNSKALPPLDGLYIGGGFPELFAEQLSKNVKLKTEIYRRAKDGLPIYAECGGLMYLVERLSDFKKKSFPMVGIFKGSVSMSNRLEALGYVELETMKDNILSKCPDSNRAHTFHWSYLDKIDRKASFAYRLRKHNKIFYDGLVNKNVLASYAHLHFASNINFAKNFIQSCKEYKNAHT